MVLEREAVSLRVEDCQTGPDVLQSQAAAALGSARVKDYQQLDFNLMSQQAPYAPLFNPRWYDFVSPRLGGYVFSEAMDAINYNTLYVKS